MRGLIVGSLLLLGTVAVFLLGVPAAQLRESRPMRTQIDEAILVANIAATLTQATTNRVMVAEYFAEHGYFPSHIDEIDPRSRDTRSAPEDAANRVNIEIANFGDVVYTSVMPTMS
jgi:hypothetical protein